jgi:hypothetical protein
LAKFTALAADTLASSHVHEVVEVVGRLERLKSIGELTRLLASGR